MSHERDNLGPLGWLTQALQIGSKQWGCRMSLVLRYQLGRNLACLRLPSMS